MAAPSVYGSGPLAALSEYGASQPTGPALSPVQTEILETLKNADLSRMRPLDAMMLLDELQSKLLN